MVSRLRVNNIAETGHSISVHLRKISNGFLVNSLGEEKHYPTFEEAEKAFLANAEEQKEKIRAELNGQIEKIKEVPLKAKKIES